MTTENTEPTNNDELSGEAPNKRRVMPKVVIDGVEYIPAKNVVANEMAIAKGLLMQFWGVCSDEKATELINDKSISVVVTDEYQGESLRSVLDEIAKQA